MCVSFGGSKSTANLFHNVRTSLGRPGLSKMLTSGSMGASEIARVGGEGEAQA